MNRVLVLLVSMFAGYIASGQHSISIKVKDDETGERLIGASVLIVPKNKGATTDSTGLAVISNVPNGKFEIQISYVGYASQTKTITIASKDVELEIELEKADDEGSPDVVVTSTRTDRSIRNTPTRIEVIAGGEISENISMRPGEIRMLLNETTGLITQQTSAISSTASLRIQQLDGRYTQLLRDGFPLYSGLSEGLSIVQIAPLDLRQVEIVKGSSSTLFGGGAISGLINLVSKTPGDKRDLSFLANGTSIEGLDLSGFYAEKYGKLGVSLFASRNSGKAYDPSGIGFTAVPDFERYTVNPRIFFYGKRTTASAGLSCITEDRLGGNINYVEHGAPGYFESNNSDRLTSQFSLVSNLSSSLVLNVKNSFNHFRRSISLQGYEFGGLQQSSFSELSLNASGQKSQWIGGINLYTDNFNEDLRSTNNLRDYRNNTVGLFVQNTWSAHKLLSIESGLRGDYTSPYGFALLPRISALLNFSPEFSSRIGGGLGYKVPTIFNEESEELHYKDIMPIDKGNTRYEKSAGANLDFTYKTNFDELKVLINPLLFYTRINHPLVLEAASGTQKQFVNSAGYVDSKGVDISFRLGIQKFKFFTGYSYTIVKNHLNGTNEIYPLSPKHRLHFDLVYELEGKLRVAFESYYTSHQQLSDGATGRAYWLLGALVEKSWKRFSLFINGEDLNDARQTKWEPIYTGTIDVPVFRDIYAPLDGVTINGGIKIKL